MLFFSSTHQMHLPINSLVYHLGIDEGICSNGDGKITPRATTTERPDEKQANVS